MDAYNAPGVHTIVFMKSAQVGATEILNNILGYIVHRNPGPVLILQPNIDPMGRAWSKDRLAPMVRDTPVLRGRLGEAKSKQDDNTILHKKFVGGHLTVAGANSPASLASRPIRDVLADEVDRYPASAGAEGDPLSLAFKRTATFPKRKRYVCSTPTIAGESRIEVAFNESDQRRYFVPCPHCDEYQTLKWSNVVWPDGEPHNAKYACDHCGAEITDGQKSAMLAKGEWRAERECRGVAGFHISELYSPWTKFAEMAQAFVEAKKQPETLKTWVNTALGEVWEEDGEQLDPYSVANRAEGYKLAPRDVLCVTCAVDVQDDRLEAELKGWGVDEESWTLDHSIWYGDPGRLELWGRLNDYLAKRIETEDGRHLRVNCTVIDSGGHFTEMVYRFSASKRGQRVYAIKGVGGPGRPVVGRPSKANKAGVQVFPIGVDTAKELVFGRLQITQPGPGYMHFPKLDEEFFQQLTSERRVKKIVRGISTYEWKKVRRRNEAWDLNVYQIAAFELLNPNLHAIAAKVDPPEPKKEPPPDTRRRIRPRPAKRRGGFVNSWKDA